MTLRIGDTAPDFEADTTEGRIRFLKPELDKRNVIIAGSVTDDEAKKIYPNGWTAPKPYLRIVPQPR